jgi:hypothetical protein
VLIVDGCNARASRAAVSADLALSMFMGQVLSEDGSCQKAVDSWAAQRAVEGLSVRSVKTGAYCKARQRLPVEMVSALSRYMAQQLTARAQDHWRWRGRSVKLVDGTGILMPDTAANQARYPQSRAKRSESARRRRAWWE